MTIYKHDISFGAQGVRRVSRRAIGTAATFMTVLALATGLPGVPAAEAKQTLVFGAYTSEKPLAMVRQLRPSLNTIADRMSEILGEEVEIKMQVAKSYVEGVALLTSGRADFMRLGPASYVSAKQRKNGLALLAVENKKGKKQNTGVICVQADSPIYDVSQLRGRSVAFGNSRSTLGRYVAQQTLMEQGVYARTLARYEYLGRHDKVGQAVASGQYDAGALSKSTFKKLVKKGLQIREIASYKSITKAWVAKAGMKPRVLKALRQTLLTLDDRKALKALRFDGFLKASDSEFDDIRKAIEVNARFFATGSAALSTGQ